MVGRVCAAIIASTMLHAVALTADARAASRHPLHTTLAQLTYDERTHQLEGSIRVFAGDFATAVAKRSGAAAPDDDRVPDAAAFAYVARTFALLDPTGRIVPLAWCGSRRAGDVLWLCVRATSVSQPASLRLSDQMLCELFDDQVNIVQSTLQGQRSSMLFTKGDGPKRAM